MLNDILESSERNNARDEVTGALLFNREWFVQVLEGRREILSKTLFRLYPDPRHAEVTIADVRRIDEQFDPRRLNGEAIMLMALAVSDTFDEPHCCGGLMSCALYK